MAVRDYKVELTFAAAIPPSPKLELWVWDNNDLEILTLPTVMKNNLGSSFTLLQNLIAYCRANKVIKFEAKK